MGGGKGEGGGFLSLLTNQTSSSFDAGDGGFFLMDFGAFYVPAFLLLLGTGGGFPCHFCATYASVLLAVETVSFLSLRRVGGYFTVHE